MKNSIHLWVERVARACVDFFAVQAAGALALVFVGARGTLARPEAVLTHYYFHTFLPISLVFPLVHSLFGLYTKLRGYTLNYKLRLAALSASVATLLVVWVSFVMSRAQLPRSAAVLFAFGVVGATVGVRWMKDWLFHRESEAAFESVAEAANLETAESVLVVGGAGYIGSLVVSELLAHGHKVKLLDNLHFGNEAIEPFLSHENLDFIRGDCRNIQDVVRAMTKVRHVIHLAAIVGDPACAEDDSNALQINYAATRMMVEIAKGHGVERFLFASSCSVYGQSEDLMDEKSETAPLSLYAETKLHSERVLFEAKSRTFHPTILRFATVFGLAPRPRFDLVVNLLTAKAIQDGVITIFNGSQWRPFIHVNDVAHAVVTTLEAPLESVSGEIFNVGDDRFNFTLGEIAEKIRYHVTGTRVAYEENGDRRNYRVSFAKARGCLGFEARLSIDDGILEIKRAYELGQIRNYRHAVYSNVSYLRERGHLDAKNDLDVKVMAAFAGPVPHLAPNASRSVFPVATQAIELTPHQPLPTRHPAN